MYATGHGAFYRSDDGGTTWQAAGGPLQTADIHAFAVSPDDANQLYAFVVNEGLLASSDGGRTWQSLTGAPTSVRALAAGPGQLVYVGSVQGSVFTSTDGGRTWQQETIGMTADLTSITYDPRSQHVIATAVMVGSDQGMLLKRNANDGTWSMLPLTDMGLPLTLTINPHEPSTLLLVNNRGELYRSIDGGATWGDMSS